jgi:hypothetical protein
MEEAYNTYGIHGKKYQILVQIGEGGGSSGRSSRKGRIILKYIVME